MTARPRREVTLVCGPPCAGKTTWVRQHASHGDLVVDHDLIAQQLGSKRTHHHGQQLREQAGQHVAHLLAHVAGMVDGVAWVIRTAPEAAKRKALARMVRADRVVVLLPPAQVLMARAQARPARGKTITSVHRWMQRYTPHDADEFITGYHKPPVTDGR